MIVPSDPDYQATKRIKQGLDQMGVPEIELADTLQREFGVRPLNILYEWVATAGRARLRVVFERYSEAHWSFIGPDRINALSDHHCVRAHCQGGMQPPDPASADRRLEGPVR